MKHRQCTQGFSPKRIAIIAIAFLIFWPIGLAVLLYTLWGGDMKAFWKDKKRKVHQAGFQSRRPSGNVAFDDYREQEIDRLQRAYEKLDDLQTDFDDYRYEQQRSRDQKQFDRYMELHEDRMKKRAKAEKKQAGRDEEGFQPA